MSEVKEYSYSEVFHSFQGEGFYTGRSTAWIRFFLCNLQCDGFGQKDPTDPSTYVLPYQDFDVSSIKRIEDLPVWEYGCDSSYTWAKKFKHLATTKNAAEICKDISSVLVSPSNPEGLFRHPATGQYHHMAFTGGEPMLNQEAIGEILTKFNAQHNLPRYVTVETNGTKLIKDPQLERIIMNWYSTVQFEWFWSVSPKLWSTAGEKPKKAIRPNVVGDYASLSNHGQLKYVVDGSEASWKEVEENTKMFRDHGVNWDVYIMPVGATLEEQSAKQVAEIAVEAMQRGYHVAVRSHVYVFGNAIGT